MKKETKDTGSKTTTNKQDELSLEEQQALQKSRSYFIEGKLSFIKMIKIEQIKIIAIALSILKSQNALKIN